jgi:hypothetical protein
MVVESDLVVYLDVLGGQSCCLTEYTRPVFISHG